MTRLQLMNQNSFWFDDFYFYAIHKTDGGALYLMQGEKEDILKASENQNIYYRQIRLDGCDILDLNRHIGSKNI